MSEAIHKSHNVSKLCKFFIASTAIYAELCIVGMGSGSVGIKTIYCVGLHRIFTKLMRKLYKHT